MRKSVKCFSRYLGTLDIFSVLRIDYRSSSVAASPSFHFWFRQPLQGVRNAWLEAWHPTELAGTDVSRCVHSDRYFRIHPLSSYQVNRRIAVILLYSTLFPFYHVSDQLATWKLIFVYDLFPITKFIIKEIKSWKISLLLIITFHEFWKIMKHYKNDNLVRRRYLLL